jgi:hypothetical protein
LILLNAKMVFLFLKLDSFFKLKFTCFIIYGYKT